MFYSSLPMITISNVMLFIHLQVQLHLVSAMSANQTITCSVFLVCLFVCFYLFTAFSLCSSGLERLRNHSTCSASKHFLSIYSNTHNGYSFSPKPCQLLLAFFFLFFYLFSLLFPLSVPLGVEQKTDK